MSASESVGTRIRAVRQARGLSQTQLAVMIGITEQSVAKIERGKFRPSASTLARLAAVLDVALAELTDENPVAS